MIRNKEHLTNIEPCNLDFVTFSDRVKGKVISNANLNNPGKPKLENVLLINNLNPSLIIISKLCDHKLLVNFSKDKFSTIDTINNSIM